MKWKILWISIAFLGYSSLMGIGNSYALLSPHPLELYEKGKTIVDAYQGNTSQLAEAQIYFTELIERYPDSPWGYLGMSRLHRIDAYRYGNHYNMKRIKEDALPFAAKALEVGASMREVHENYSIFEKIFEDYDKTREQAQKYLFLIPDTAETCFTIANLLHDQAEFKKSIEYYEKALDHESSEALKVKIFKRMGVLYLDELYNPAKAAEYFKKALEIQNDSPVLNEYLGIAYLKQEKYQLSIEKLTKSLKPVRTSFQEYHLLQARAFLSEENGSLDEAIGYLEKAVKYNRKNTFLNYSLGDLYYRTEEYEKAYLHFQQVIDLSPHISKAFYFAGRAIHSLGNPDLAIDYYRKYLKLNNEGKEAEWIRKNIPDLSHK